MQVKLGIWSVANSSDHGEIEWAGGVPDWSAAPYKGYFKSVEIEDYMGFCNQTDGYVEYQYDERTVGWQQIRIAGCQGRPGPELPTASPIETGDATATQTGDGEGPKPSGEEGGDDESIACLSMGLASTLAVAMFFGWFLIL